LLLPRPLCNCLSCDSLQSAAIRVDKVPDFWAPGLLGCLREGNLGVHCANTQMNLLKHPTLVWIWINQRLNKMLSICISTRFNKQFVSLANGQRQVSLSDSFKNTSKIHISCPRPPQKCRGNYFDFGDGRTRLSSVSILLFSRGVIGAALVSRG